MGTTLVESCKIEVRAAMTGELLLSVNEEADNATTKLICTFKNDVRARLLETQNKWVGRHEILLLHEDRRLRDYERMSEQCPNAEGSISYSFLLRPLSELSELELSEDLRDLRDADACPAGEGGEAGTDAGSKKFNAKFMKAGEYLKTLNDNLKNLEESNEAGSFTIYRYRQLVERLGTSFYMLLSFVACNYTAELQHVDPNSDATQLLVGAFNGYHTASEGSLFHVAANYGDVRVLNALLNFLPPPLKVGVDTTDVKGDTALFHAVGAASSAATSATSRVKSESMALEAVNLLLANGANAKTRPLQIALALAVHANPDVESNAVAQRLFKAGTRIHKDQLLIWQDRNVTPARARGLIKLGADANAVKPDDPERASVLQTAASLGRHELVKVLLEEHANACYENAWGKTALEMAVIGYSLSDSSSEEDSLDEEERELRRTLEADELDERRVETVRVLVDHEDRHGTPWTKDDKDKIIAYAKREFNSRCRRIHRFMAARRLPACEENGRDGRSRGKSGQRKGHLSQDRKQ